MCTRVADAHFIFPIMYRHCTKQIASHYKTEGCAYDHGNCKAPASYARCHVDADCDALAPGHKGHLTCDGLPIHCNSSQFCTNGQPSGGELCNLTAGEPNGPRHSAGGRSVGPDCAGPNDGLLEVQMAVSSDGMSFKRVSRMAFVARGSGRHRPGTPGVWKGEFDAASTAVAVGTVDSGDETLMYEIGWQCEYSQPPHPALMTLSLTISRFAATADCRHTRRLRRVWAAAWRTCAERYPLIAATSTRLCVSPGGRGERSDDEQTTALTCLQQQQARSGFDLKPADLT
jgi:hypothetical protein